MGATLADRRQDTKIVKRLAELEEQLEAIRANQAQKLTFNGLVLDGTGAEGVLKSGDNDIVDATGLNSLINFPKAQLINASSPDTTSTSFIDVTGSTLGTFTLTRNANVLIYFSIGGYNTTTQGNFLNCQYVDNGTTLQALSVTGDFVTDVTQDPVTKNIGVTESVSTEFAFFMQFVQLAAGSHTLKLQFRAAPGGHAYLEDWLIGYIIFGS